MNGTIYKKNGQLSKLKLDGTHRIAAGGYNKEKQSRWGREVLNRATALAKRIFSHAWESAVILYAETDSGYEGVKREFYAKYKTEEYKELLQGSRDRLERSQVFSLKYLNFLQEIEELNFSALLAKALKIRAKKEKCKKV